MADLKCPKCHGTGKCTACGGAGCSDDEHDAGSGECVTCRGRGKITPTFPKRPAPPPKAPSGKGRP